MSEKIEIGIVCSQYSHIDMFLQFIEKYISSELLYEVKSISNWEWNDFRGYNGDLQSAVESNFILIYYLNNDSDIGAYQYKSGKDYVTEIWLPTDRIEQLGSLKDFVKDISQKIKEELFELNAKYAYIGNEACVFFSDNYNEMKEKSTDILKWIFPSI